MVVEGMEAPPDSGKPFLRPYGSRGHGGTSGQWQALPTA
jgi:hypothetical protein